MEKITKTKLSSFWLILFLFLVFSFTLSITNETYATCPGGYCYDDGTNAQGGSCGSSTSTIWWDTCFGLSWQYYEWPVGHVGNIKIHGTANSGGDATIDAQCAEYGGFWFLGYEAYNPSIGTSLGYQIAKPKVSMLKSYGGKSALFPYSGSNNPSSFHPSSNPYSTPEGLTGSRYGDAYEVESIFYAYLNAGEEVSNITDFTQVNWFCAKKPEPDGLVPRDDPDPEDGDIPPPTPEPVYTSYARGRSVVKIDGKNWARTAWSKNGDTVRLAITLKEGESKGITFRHRVIAKGELAQPISYSIEDTASTTRIDGFYEYDGVSMDTSAELYDEEIIVDREGSYCQTLTIRYERPSGTQTRTSTACIDVTVIPTPPELFGRVEVTVGEQTVSSEWNGGTEDPAILDVTLHEGEEADVQFNHFMKGVDGNTARAKFTIEDTYYIGKRYSNYFEYDSADSGTEVNVYTNTIDGIAKTMTVCETLTYTYYNETKSAEACARITLLRPSRVIRTPDDDVSTIRFSAQIDPYIQLKTGTNGLITSGNVAELLQTGTTIDIITNNISGYTATITSNRNSTDEHPTSLYNRYAKMYIPTLEGSVLKSEFPTNYWGFSFEDENGDNDSSSYNGLEPLDSATPFVFSNTNAPSDDSFFVSFATKADLTKASGVYSSSVSIKAVASIVPYIHDTIDDLHYMQDINDSVIESMVVNQQYKLYDQRDGKGYWVAKLGDGNVWMTQDLDFELTAGDRLFEGYSDIPRNRDNTIYASYFEIEGTTSKDIKEPWLSKNPEKRKYGQTYTAGIPISGTHSYRPASDPLLGTTVRFTIEDDYGEKTADVIVPNYNVDGKRLSYYADSAACAAANETTVEECEHRLVGVYYNGAAMESSEFSSTNGYDRKTICPGRWTIPTSSELGNLMSQKAPDVLLDAPYYFNYGGLYGYRNATITYSQWLSQPNVIVYNYKNHSDSYYFYTFPYGFSESYIYGDNVFTSTNYSYNTRNLEGQAAPLRCIARKGY